MSSTQQRNLVDSRFILRPVSSDNCRLHQGVWNKITWGTYLYITFVRDIILEPTVLAKTVGPKIISRTKYICHTLPKFTASLLDALPRNLSFLYVYP